MEIALSVLAVTALLTIWMLGLFAFSVNSLRMLPRIKDEVFTIVSDGVELVGTDGSFEEMRGKAQALSKKTGKLVMLKSSTPDSSAGNPVFWYAFRGRFFTLSQSLKLYEAICAFKKYVDSSVEVVKCAIDKQNLTTK